MHVSLYFFMYSFFGSIQPIVLSFFNIQMMFFIINQIVSFFVNQK